MNDKERELCKGTNLGNWCSKRNSCNNHGGTSYFVDLEFVYNIPIGYGTGFIDKIRIVVATLFIMVSGISTAFSKNSFKRGVVVLSAALLISFVTFIVGREYFISFGVLHLIGLCMIVSPFLKKIPTPSLLILSLIIGMTQFVIPYVEVSHNYFFMFGFTMTNLLQRIIICFSVGMGFLFGIVLSRLFYREKKSIFKFTIKENPIGFLEEIRF